MNGFRIRFVVISLLLAGLSATACAPRRVAPAAAATAPIGSAACFPVESLDSHDRGVADDILLTLSDGEGLYTLAGGLKPVSSGQVLSVRVEPDVDAAALARLDQRRRVSRALQCGDISIFVQTFAAAQKSDDGRTLRVTEIVAAHRTSVAAAIRRHEVFFNRLGISPSADPFEVVAAVEHAERADRWRGYGYLYGYPDEAVDFFVRAGSEGDTTGTLVAREFRRIDTFTRFPARAGGPPELSSFVYAVPAGAPETEAERRLRAVAAPVYARYVAERQTWVTADRRGAVALWRSWLTTTLRPSSVDTSR
jgi:hypothetical protein